MSYPDINDKDFYAKINKKFKKYTVPKKRKTFNQICYPKDYQLQIPQKFLAQYINPKSPYKDVLVFHKIGAGKTCTAVNIGEHWKKHRRVVVVTPASLVGNFRDELRSRCAKNAYLTDKERVSLIKHHPSSPEYRSIIAESDKRIDKHYTIMSYNRFVDLHINKKLSLRNSVLIVDEVQNMVSAKGLYYTSLYDAIHQAPSSLRVVLLSATPMFDKPVEIALTMNLMRLPVEFPVGNEFDKMFIKTKTSYNKTRQNAKNLTLFKKMIKGYISYFRGAAPYVFPESSIKYVKCEMSDFQHRSYITVLKDEEKKFATRGPDKQIFTRGSILKLPNNFSIGTRIVSNIAFPNRHINEKGFKSLTPTHMSTRSLATYSVKFHEIITKIRKATGPVVVYSNFKEYGGLKSFAHVLEYYGYSDYLSYGEGKNRYASWTGDVNMNLREEIKGVYNQTSNSNGSKLRVLLLSPSGKEGLSLKNVRQMHILEPYWNWSRMLQIIGRAIRYCSHKDLPEEKRSVDVFIYLAVHYSEPETIDEYTAKMAQKKNRLIQEFEQAIKEAAVDCSLFYNANVYPGEDRLRCEK